MSEYQKFSVTEFELTVRVQIATYYPSYIKESTTKILNAVSRAAGEVGRDLDFLTGVTSISLKEKANEDTKEDTSR